MDGSDMYLLRWSIRTVRTEMNGRMLLDTPLWSIREMRVGENWTLLVIF